MNKLISFIRRVLKKILFSKIFEFLKIRPLITNIIKLVLYVYYFGFKGINMFIMKFNSKKGIYRFKHKKFKFPIYLRKKTSDFEVFEQTFLFQDFSYKYNFKPKVIFDLGANIGTVSVYFKNKFPNSKIISVEPDSSNYSILDKNLKNYSNCFSLKTGIWSEKCKLEIINPTGSKYGFQLQKSDNGTIEATSIPQLMKEFNIEHIDILKIDIEGSELDLLQQNYEWLSKVKMIFIEPHIINGVDTKKIILQRAKEFKFKTQEVGELVILYK